MTTNVGFRYTSQSFDIRGGFVIDDSTGQILSVSGTINNTTTIDGLSDYDGADNKLVNQVTRMGTTFYNLDASGVSFTAGGVSYNVARIDGTGYVLTDSADAGATQTGSFSATSSSTPCFTTGTRIRTVRGDIPVEELKVGDLVVTASGRVRPIKWIGSRTLTAGTPPNSF